MADDDEAFATAKPDWMLPLRPDCPDDSTYIRNAVPLTAGTPATDTVAAAGLYENKANGAGPGPVPLGRMRIDPDAIAPAALVVTNFCDVRRATEWRKCIARLTADSDVHGLSIRIEKLNSPCHSIVGWIDKQYLSGPPAASCKVWNQRGSGIRRNRCVDDRQRRHEEEPSDNQRKNDQTQQSEEELRRPHDPFRQTKGRD